MKKNFNNSFKRVITSIVILLTVCSTNIALVNAEGNLSLDLSPFGIEIGGDGSGKANIKVPSGNLANGAYSNNSIKDSGTDQVIVDTSNKVFSVLKRISGFVLAISIVALTGLFTWYLIKLGGTSDNESSREKVLVGLKWIALSLAVLGSVFVLFGYLISIIK